MTEPKTPQQIADEAIKKAGGKKIRLGKNRGKWSADKAVKAVEKKNKGI